MKRSRTLINGLIIAGFAVLSITGIEFLAVNIGQPVPFTQNYMVHAVFSNADGIPTAADVRVSGVDAGKVVAVASDPSYPGETVVTMEITSPGAVPVYTNGYAMVRPKTLLGEKYVDLTVGNGATAEPISSGGFLPPSQTGKDVSNDEIFNAFDATTRQNQRQVLQALDAALQQRAGNIQNILPQLQTVIQNLDPLAHVYEQDQPQVDAIFVQLNTIMKTLADEHVQVGGVLSNGSIALGAIAQKDQALTQTLQEAAAVAGELNTALAPTIRQQQLAINELAPALQAQNNSCNDALGQRERCGQNDLLNQVVLPQASCGGRPCGIDEVFTGTLLGNVNYPNDQLTVSSKVGEIVTDEWNSMFSQPSDVRALNLVISFHCDAITTSLGQVSPSSDLAKEIQALLHQLNASCPKS